jgi:hypothetical protein
MRSQAKRSSGDSIENPVSVTACKVVMLERLMVMLERVMVKFLTELLLVENRASTPFASSSAKKRIRQDIALQQVLSFALKARRA